MSPSPKSAPPTRARLDSGVMTRVPPSAPERGQGRSAGSADGPVERSERIQSKMRIAAEVLSGLAPNDSRAALLAAALHRRDEALLDGVLAELRARPTVPPPSTKIR